MIRLHLSPFSEPGSLESSFSNDPHPHRNVFPGFWIIHFLSFANAPKWIKNLVGVSWKFLFCLSFPLGKDLENESFSALLILEWPLIIPLLLVVLLKISKCKIKFIYTIIHQCSHGNLPSKSPLFSKHLYKIQDHILRLK